MGWKDEIPTINDLEPEAREYCSLMGINPGDLGTTRSCNWRVIARDLRKRFIEMGLISDYCERKEIIDEDRT